MGLEVIIIEPDENSTFEQKSTEIKKAFSNKHSIILNLNNINSVYKEEKFYKFIKDNFSDSVHKISEHVYVIANLHN